MPALHRRQLLLQGTHLVGWPQHEKEVMQRRGDPLMDDPSWHLRNAGGRGQHVYTRRQGRPCFRHQGKIQHDFPGLCQHLIQQIELSALGTQRLQLLDQRIRLVAPRINPL